MSASWFYLLLALLAGALMPTQAAVNHRMANFVQHPVLSAFLSFGIGTLALGLYILISGIPLSQLKGALAAPASAWVGGLCGAFFVASVVALVPRLGVALTFSLLIAGQMIATLPIDHYGFLGVPLREITLPRLLGVALVIAGVLLIRKY